MHACNLCTHACRLVVGEQDMSMALLASGLGCLHPSFVPERIFGAQQLIAAQEAAQKGKRGMWHSFDPAAAEAEDAAALAATSAVNIVTVSHICSGAKPSSTSLNSKYPRSCSYACNTCMHETTSRQSVRFCIVLSNSICYVG
jgi:hypothetical protein